MAANVSLADALVFYRLERELFNRMVGRMNKDPQLVKRAMAFWLMQQENGYNNLTQRIHGFDDWAIEAIFNESLARCDCIQPDAVEPIDMNRRFFYNNREFMYTRYMHMMNTVCNRIFGERSAVRVNESVRQPVFRSFGEGTSVQGSALGATSSGTPERILVRGGEARRQSTLNPNAIEFVPGQTHEDTPTMFLTFSWGSPVPPQEIFKFFTSEWGDVVEDVVVKQPGEGQEPPYGLITFKDSRILPSILKGQDKAKFKVEQKDLWASIYVPRRR